MNGNESLEFGALRSENQTLELSFAPLTTYQLLMIPVALPPRVAGDGLKDPSSYFV